MRVTRIITSSLKGFSGTKLSGFGMSRARFASLLSVMIFVIAAPAGANSRMAPRDASTFSLNAAAAIGSRWGSVTSTSRTRQRNHLVGGAPNSFHLTGRAIDIARRRGVRHADIEASYRNAGFILIESLDEGDHSHFAFAVTRWGAANAVRRESTSAIGGNSSGCLAAPSTSNAALGRRRPDRTDGCPGPEELKDANSVAALVASP